MQRFFSSVKITLFNNELQKVNIDPVLKETDSDISFHVLLKDYMNLFNKYFPKQVIKDNKKNHNWFDDELKKLLFNKEALFFYLFSFLLTINLKLIKVHVEIKIVNKEAATKRSTLLHAQCQLCMVAVPLNKAM